MYATYPVYYPSARYARENGEIDLWRESHNINQICKDFIGEKAAPAFHCHALPDFIGELTDEYGPERAMYVIGRTVMGADWDKRYDSNVRERAARFGYHDMKEGLALREAGKDPYRFSDRTTNITSDVHPCILNAIFRALMKMEQEQAVLPSADADRDNELDEGAEI